MPKENPNPIVHTTRKHHPSYLTAGPSLGSSAIRRYHLCSQSPSRSSSFQHLHRPQDNDIAPADAYYNAVHESHVPWGSITAEDRSVAIALSAASYPSAYTSSSSNPSARSSLRTDLESESPKLDLLQQAGFALFHPRYIQRQCKVIRYPSYSPVAVRQQPLPEKEVLEHCERDTITVNEIFDIIRNIQDPEHPLTLEQLNVVRLELIDVNDLEGGRGGECSSQMNGCAPKRFSTVHVQFTWAVDEDSIGSWLSFAFLWSFIPLPEKQW